ncbi:histamine H2 receptor-like, partial [Stylophora pistillata]|uniref:histamine H2 receptor-like n=1 Tax=Stylophora pistillata TaxID=50429 RepID=UPI000C053E48
HQVQDRNTATVVFETVTFSLTMILSLSGNLMVCYAVRRNPRLRHSSNYYIISLALTDISLAFLTMPLSVVLLATGKWPFGTFLTRFATISKLSLTNISTFTMALMAMNRYDKIVKPAKYQTLFTKKFIISTALMVWATFVFLAPLSVLVFGFPNVVKPAFAVPVTIFSRQVGIPTAVIIFYSPYAVIIFCYWKVYKTVKIHIENVSWQSANVEDVRVSKILLVTVVGFLSLWFPAQNIFFVSDIWLIPRQLALFATLLIYSSSFINPFIYGFMNRSFRNEFKKCLSLKNKQSIGTESSPRKPENVVQIIN